MKKILPFVLLTVLALLPLFGEGKSFTKDSSLSVMFSSYDSVITYSFDFATENEEKLLATVHAFSYSDKSMGDFTFSAEKQRDGTFSAKRQVVPCERDGKTIDVTVSSAKIDTEREQVEIKFKPGKMPFAISLRTK